MLMNLAIIPEDVCIRRLEMNTDFQDTSKLLLSAAPHVKELKLEGEFAIDFVASKQLWDSISTYRQLRHLSIKSTNYFDFEYDCCSRTDALSCLKVLRLKSFEVGGFGARQLFDSAETILSTFQDNSHLRRLGLKAEAKLLSSPLLLPILSNLHRLSIEAIFVKSLSNPVADDDDLMSDICFILQSLPYNAILCMKLKFTDMEDEVTNQMLSCVKTFLDLSNNAKNPIRLIFEHGRRPLPYPDVDEMASLIEEQQWFGDEVEDLFEIERRPCSCIVSGNDAKVIVSIVND
uniref:Uncharacterized protein n=1 Tax=Plectus sambesii TaxID=2011161 RepID=A0A914XI50_9BILA